jgi:predicted MFS family arabinose efflux permease
MLICFALFVAFSHWQAYLPLYALAVGLTLGDVGVIRGAFGLCQVAARPVGGLPVGRLGHPKMVVCGLLVQTLMLALVPLFSTLLPLLVLFVVNGTARALAIVANAVELVEAAEEARVSRGVMAGAYNTAMDMGMLAGPAVGGLLANSLGVAASFVAVPLLTLALAAAALALLAARPRPHALSGDA